MKNIPDIPGDIPGPWQKAVAPFITTEELDALNRAVQAEYHGGTIFPAANQVFAALEVTPPDALRAVWLGQDPYHEPGQATGLAFSVSDDAKAPPSLRNILREYSADLGLPIPAGHSLRPWAEHGVLLLNTVLTVRAGRARSHRHLGWEALTTAVIKAAAALPSPIAFILLGNDARAYKPLIPAGHVVFEAAHPSPLSANRGFIGARPFTSVNQALTAKGAPPIDWRLDSGLLPNLT